MRCTHMPAFCMRHQPSSNSTLGAPRPKSTILPVQCVAAVNRTTTIMVDISPCRSTDGALFVVSHADVNLRSCAALLEYLQRAATGATCDSPEHGSFTKQGGDGDLWWCSDHNATCTSVELLGMLRQSIESRALELDQALNSQDIIITKCEPRGKTEGEADNDLFEAKDSTDTASLDIIGNSSSASDQVRSMQLAHRPVPPRT